MTGTCGCCHVAPAESGEAWCTDCLDESRYDAYILGVHVSQLDPAEVRRYGCTCPAGDLHAGGCPVLSL